MIAIVQIAIGVALGGLIVATILLGVWLWLRFLFGVEPHSPFLLFASLSVLAGLAGLAGLTAAAVHLEIIPWISN